MDRLHRVPSVFSHHSVSGSADGICIGGVGALCVRICKAPEKGFGAEENRTPPLLLDTAVLQETRGFGATLWLVVGHGSGS